MSRVVDDLWTVAGGLPHVDADTLATAIEAAAREDNALDYRTRLLIRDGLRALESHWGYDRFQTWLAGSPARLQIETACKPETFDPDPEEIGFPSLKRRVVDAVKPEVIERFLRDLSLRISQPTHLMIGGSIPLILAGYLTRNTEDVDVVDEVPAELRAQHQLLDELTGVYKLKLAHFQSHYLPSGWDKRLRSLAGFGKLQVFLVDPYDIFVGKLFSVRMKDRADLNALTSQLDHQTIRRRLRETTTALRSDPRLLDAAKQNWFVLFGEDLPE